MTYEIRPYRPADRAAVGEVCVRTAAGGDDARGLYSDETLMAEVFAWPYVDSQPELAWVVVRPAAEPDAAEDDPDAPLRSGDEAVVGYVIGVADTAAFIDWWQREWTPGFVARHPAPGTAPRPGAKYTEASLLRDGADPERMRNADLATHPAHLHIDLLPEAQGRGLGRTLIDTLRAALAVRGVPGVHLGMDPANTNARAFYDRLGFVELPTHRADLPLLGIATS
ncbi:GNAT family N-acetyltransferase [Agromyces intestinalis]|uniref:GNAT family N-acetyltransferase n=1 Tax=Agromyces intestinalis TaxID=2592652 RepID=A0A5C1YCF4_9MICO|nr:GNAT family N-acetyltransferase [Agromyces intestinalis]QEO13711.1 GNAT family N-acetyltransferase [Agromyces intestinalis]